MGSHKLKDEMRDEVKDNSTLASPPPILLLHNVKDFTSVVEVFHQSTPCVP